MVFVRDRVSVQIKSRPNCAGSDAFCDSRSLCIKAKLCVGGIWGNHFDYKVLPHKDRKPPITANDNGIARGTKNMRIKTRYCVLFLSNAGMSIQKIPTSLVR